MGTNDDYTTSNILDYEYFKDIFAVELSKKIKLENPDLKQQINFIGRFK